jgi:predicted transcriptional regulator
MPRRKKKPHPGLAEPTPLELEIMQVVWARGDATAAEVARALGARRELADTTIHTVLANLSRKGYLRPVPTIERALRFAPAVEREQVAARSLRQLLRDFFDGSPRRLMAHLVKQEAVDARELAEIRKILKSRPDARSRHPKKKEP